MNALLPLPNGPLSKVALALGAACVGPSRWLGAFHDSTLRLVERMLGARIQLLVKKSLCRRHGHDVASMEMRSYEQSSDVAVVRMF